MGELAVPESGGTIERPTRGPGRPLGIRAEPTLRLAIGYRDPNRRGAPVKVDYFIAKDGPDGAHAAAAEKFRRVLGDKPKSIPIRLPAEMRQALDVRHRAWAGTGGDDGGVLRALGHTNFAEVGTLGGPDTLTVWQPDGTVDEVDITSVDDPAALELGVELYTTFRFHIPSVLGAAGYAEITSKGQKTTDNLFARLTELYGMLGHRVSWAIEPRLVLKRSSARPVLTDRKTGEVRRAKTVIWTLDLYVPESIEDMLARLHERQALLYPGGQEPAAALYGPAAADVDAEDATAGEAAAAGVDASHDHDDDGDIDFDGPEFVDEEEPVEGEIVDDTGEPAFDGEEPGFEAPAGAVDEDAVAAGREAGQVVVTFGKKHPGWTIHQIAADRDDPDFVIWVAGTMTPRNDQARAIQQAAQTYARVFLGWEQAQ